MTAFSKCLLAGLVLSFLSGCGCRVLLKGNGNREAKAEEISKTSKIVLYDMNGKELRSWSGKSVSSYTSDESTFIEVDSKQIIITKSFFVEINEE